MSENTVKKVDNALALLAMAASAAATVAEINALQLRLRQENREPTDEEVDQAHIRYLSIRDQALANADRLEAAQGTATDVAAAAARGKIGAPPPPPRPHAI